MGCPTTPLSCLEPSNIFAGVYNHRCGGFADPSNFQAERAIFKSGYEELINNYGVEFNYYVNGFNLSAMNMLYGEHPTQEYSGPFIIKAYLELEESVSLSRWGMESDDELTAYISIGKFLDTFIQYMADEQGLLITDELGNRLTNDTISSNFYINNGQRIEPKSDDLMEITALGCDRPGNRGSKIFKITEVLDQSVSGGINPMLGHYVWKITAKRYEYDSSTNAPEELGNNQVYDNSISGKLSSVLFPTLTADTKVYPFNVDDISKNEVYDMSKNDTSLYGEYY
jgi:hypothetical protein